MIKSTMNAVVDFGNDGFTMDVVIHKDGDQWCCLAGGNLESSIAGFGCTVERAIQAFKFNVINEAAK